MSALGKPFGYYLKAKRKALGLSQAALSDKAKIQRTSISRLESHAANPQWIMIRQLAEDGMGISVGEFFQVDPLESRQPVILVNGQSPAPKLAEIMLKTQGKPIPVLNSETPLRSKVVTDQDISGYCVLDYGLLKNFRDRPLVVWKCPELGPDLAACWLVVDIKDTVMKDGEAYLVDLDGPKPRRAWLSDAGSLILEPTVGDEIKPVAFWGRQRDRVETLGRIVITCWNHIP